MTRFDLTDADYSFNASLDPFLVLKKMGFTENSVYQEGDIVRVHCPIHKDLVRKSLIIDVSEKTYRCQYANCEAHEGGILVELVALYYDCNPSEVPKALFGQEDKANDLLFRGEMFINQGRHSDALPYLEQAVEFDPRNEVTRCKLAALYLELNRKDDAYREYLKAAESYAVRGELEKTLAIYNILIMLQPGAVKARKELSFLFSRMGRPDAAAEQLKWVVDFYMRYNQAKGAEEACNQILELDPSSSMAHILLAKIYMASGKRVPAMQAFEKGARQLLDQGDLARAVDVLREGVELAPGNPRLKEMLTEAERRYEGAESEGTPIPVRRQPGKVSAGEEQEFIDWLGRMDKRLATGGDVADIDALRAKSSAFISGKTPRGGQPEDLGSSTSLDIPLFKEMDSQRTPLPSKATPAPSKAPVPAPDPPVLPSDPVPPDDTSEISVDDRRVAIYLADLKGMDNDQIEAMRAHLVTMFTESRKTYEDGMMSEWEMRPIKDFYKAFCVAVDIHRKQTAASKGA
jgi:Tfp pilus assembly protein PilF